MLQKTQGIILHNVKYGDKKVISKIYTLHFGLQSYAVNVGSSTKSKIKPAHLQPLNQVEIEVFAKEKNEVNRITEMRVLYPYKSLSTHIFKNCIASFLNEILYKTLKENSSNEALFDFVTYAFQDLDERERDYNSWHLWFLMELSQHLGFFPQNNFSVQQQLFNQMDGRFESSIPPHPHYLEREESVVFHRLLSSYHEYEHNGFVNAQERALQLALLLQYYRVHVPGFNELRSLSVLQSTLQA